MRKAIELAGVLLGALLLGILATTPPAPRDVDSSSHGFSAARAMTDVATIASAPHPTASAENARVRGYLAGRMQALGMEVSTDTGVVGDWGTKRLARWSGREVSPVTLTNVIGVLPGKDSALPAVLLMAHHDTVWGSPGAADDSAGIAASLEVVRAIRANGQPRRDLIVLASDAEELGLEGAEHFFAQHPLRGHVGAVINMEARGGGGRTTLFQTSAQNGEAVALYADAAGRPGASSLAAFVYSVLPNDTDLTPVIAGPYTAYNFAFIGRPGLYHSPKAKPDRLDRGALQDMGGQVLDLTAALLGADQLPGKAPDAVFFDLFGLTTVTYGTGLGWVMLALAAAGLGLALRGESAGEAGRGALRMAGLIVFAGLVLTLLNKVSLAPGKPNYYDRLAAIPQLELMALYGAAASALLVFGGWHAARGGRVGAMLPLLALGLAAQWLAPTAAYVVTIPVLLTALVLALDAYGRARWAALANAVLVTGYMLALGHQLMQGVGPTMPGAAALPLALAMAALLPVWAAIPRKRALAAGGAFLLAGLAVALWVRLDAPADTIAAYADNKS